MNRSDWLPSLKTSSLGGRWHSGIPWRRPPGQVRSPCSLMSAQWLCLPAMFKGYRISQGFEYFICRNNFFHVVGCNKHYRLELTSLLSILNHPQRNSVFHRPSRIEELAFCHWKFSSYPVSFNLLLYLHISHLRPADWAILLILTSGVLPMACNTFGMMPGLPFGICSVWGPCIIHSFSKSKNWKC